MKYIITLLLCICIMTACKHDHPPVNGNTTKLTAILADSSGVIVSLGYTGDQITSIGKNDPIKIEYTDSNATPYIILLFPPDSVYYAMLFALSPSKLPLRIDMNDFNGGSEEKINFAKFFYKNNTDLLDSVISFEGSYNSYIYKFTYTDQNITQITRAQIVNNTSYPVDTFNFTYSNTPNIFRHTNPLLYIYTYPQTIFNAQPNVVSSFFAETFSASTFTSITINTVGYTWSGYEGTYNMNFILNADGKITDEIINGAVFKKYYYQ